MQINEINPTLFSVQIDNDLADLLRTYFERYKKVPFKEKKQILSIYILEYEFFEGITAGDDIMISIPTAIAMAELYAFYCTYPPGDNYDFDFSLLYVACEKAYQNSITEAIQDLNKINGNNLDNPYST